MRLFLELYAFLVLHQLLFGRHTWLQGACGLDSSSVLKILTMNQVHQDEKAHRNVTYYKTALAEHLEDFRGGEFALFFENCERMLMVSFKLRVSLYNVNKAGNKDYLPVGEDVFPSLYMVSSTCIQFWPAIIISNATCRP